jgi:hypothetical protein
VPSANVYRIDNKDPLLLLLKGALNTYSRYNNILDLYPLYYALLSRYIILKFLAKNIVNITLC